MRQGCCDDYFISGEVSEETGTKIAEALGCKLMELQENKIIDIEALASMIFDSDEIQRVYEKEEAGIDSQTVAAK